FYFSVFFCAKTASRQRRYWAEPQDPKFHPLKFFAIFKQLRGARHGREKEQSIDKYDFFTLYVSKGMISIGSRRKRR
ncbi:hypothetical protein DVP42_20180, partial [Yersinia enterocolitica]|nr:hypothetical protein [Yersinia enterocolitica]